MTGQTGGKTEFALRLVSEDGLTPYAAAKKAGIALSTIYRALNRAKTIQTEAHQTTRSSPL